MVSLTLVKKGQLRGNTVGVLVAVICIVLLLGGAGYFLYHYFFLSAQQNEEQARGLLNVLDGKIGAMKEGQESSFLVKGPCEANTDPCHWYLTGWGKQDDNRPQRCFFKSCVCVCHSNRDAIVLGDKDPALRDACQNGQTGFCAPVDVEKVKIYSNQQRAGIAIMTRTDRDPEFFAKEKTSPIDKSFIPFASNLIELKMQRSADQLEISLI